MPGWNRQPSDADREAAERAGIDATSDLARHNAEKLLEWKHARLAMSGFTVGLATLVIDWNVDIGYICGLVRAGADPVTAAQIVRPLDD